MSNPLVGLDTLKMLGLDEPRGAFLPFGGLGERLDSQRNWPMVHASFVNPTVRTALRNNMKDLGIMRIR